MEGKSSLNDARRWLWRDEENKNCSRCCPLQSVAEQMLMFSVERLAFHAARLGAIRTDNDVTSSDAERDTANGKQDEESAPATLAYTRPKMSH